MKSNEADSGGDRGLPHPGEGWTPLPHSARNRCFGCGPVNPYGLHLEFYRNAEGVVLCPAKIPELYEGPPGYVHGGILATLLDEAMSKSVRAQGVVAVTRHLEADYRLPVPSCAPIRIEGRHMRSEGRKHWTEAAIYDADNRALVRGKALFIEIEPRNTAVVVS